jgi:peptidyl-prolyl cis-trans isomerase C
MLSRIYIQNLNYFNEEEMKVGKLFVASLLILDLSIGLVNAEGVATKNATNQSDNVVLVSNARAAVTRADFEVEIERVPEKDRFEFLASRERIGKVLEDMLVRKTMASEALESGLDKLPKTIVRLAAARDRVLATERIQNLTQDAKVPDFELRAKEVYRVNPDKFSAKPPMVRASHILINFKSHSKEDALKLAREVKALAMSGEDFGKLAEKYSDDKNAKKGELGFFSADMMIKPFSDAAFAMKPGEISEPVETEYGFHVIRVDEIMPAGSKPDFESVKGSIFKELKAEYLEELKKNYLINIRTDKAIIINEEEILKMKTSLPPAVK